MGLYIRRPSHLRHVTMEKRSLFPAPDLGRRATTAVRPNQEKRQEAYQLETIRYLPHETDRAALNSIRSALPTNLGDRRARGTRSLLTLPYRYEENAYLARMMKVVGHPRDRITSFT